MGFGGNELSALKEGECIWLLGGVPHRVFVSEMPEYSENCPTQFVQADVYTFVSQKLKCIKLYLY